MFFKKGGGQFIKQSSQGYHLIRKDQVDTISGSLNDKIELKPDTLLELTDTPTIYEPDKFLKSTISGAVWDEANNFGAWYGWSSSDAESSTNSKLWVNKLTYTSPVIPDGYYRIGYCFEWRRSSISSDFKARVQIDNTTTIMEINIEAKDKRSWHSVSGFDMLFFSSGSYTIDLDFSSEIISKRSYIRRARLEFWMVTG